MIRVRYVSQFASTMSLLCVVVAVLVCPTAGRAGPLYARDGDFGKETVVEMARSISRAPFVAAKAPLPESLAKLDYDHYRDIRVRPSSTIWAKKGTLFRIQLLPRGFLFTDAVEIALVSRGHAQHVPYGPELFTTGAVMKAPLPKEDIGFSGFRVLYPINRPGLFDEAAVFQGASYFRSLGVNQVYGLAARGLANKTAEPEGEEFPVFRAFWIDEPSPSGKSLIVYALLDSPATVGAYRFKITPGRSTVMEVEVSLFPRAELSKVGIAPANSMFMFSPNGRIAVDDFRPEVHDSDGLLILNGRGEHIWRPLANPAEIQVSAFLDENPRGFGLLQRDRNLADYQDFEAHYERRPSLWVEPLGDWGPGSVVLTEIPSDAEIHDNIVAFWRPKAPIPANSQYQYSYRLSWGDGPKAATDTIRVLATRRGRSDVQAPTKLRRFAIDYEPALDEAGARLRPPQANVSASAGEIRDVVVSENPILGGYRVGFVFDPKDKELSELRVDLTFKENRHAETWVYRWTGP